MLDLFSFLPPEINSARIFSGAGSGPLWSAAKAWDGLSTDLQAAASSFQSVITDLASMFWSGPASGSMAAAATPYVAWLGSAAQQAETASSLAQWAATAFETALNVTVHPAAVTANRTSLMSLIATNILGINTPAIFANEFAYQEMWAQDVAAMTGYDTTATAVASAMSPFDVPALSFSGLTGLVTNATTAISGLATEAASVMTWGSSGLSGLVSEASSTVSTVASQAGLSDVSSAISGLTSSTDLASLATEVQSAASAVPVSDLMSAAQIGMYPASMMISPLTSLAQSANGTAGLAGATGAGLTSADMPKFVGSQVEHAGGMGSALSKGLGQARLVGAMSVPPTWQGSMPARMASSAMAGLGMAGMPDLAQLTAAAGTPTGTGGMPMMPMPMGGGAGAGTPGGMLGRGGASPHVQQNRPSVVPRAGIG